MQIEAYRRTKDKALKENLPCYTVSGIFSERKESGLIKHSGVVCIDIDKKDNPDVVNFSEIKKLIGQIPYVAYCGYSCGGEGYCVFIPIKQTDKHRNHYSAIVEDFERCGITVDKHCIDISRLRFASFDDEAYYNYEAVVYSRLKEEKQATPKNECQNKTQVFTPNKFSNNTDNTEQKVQKLKNQISQKNIDITGEYKQWLEIGAAIANEFGENGRSYFHAISQYHSKYDQRETDCQYYACSKMTNFTIGTLFHYAKQYGIST